MIFKLVRRFIIGCGVYLQVQNWECLDSKKVYEATDGKTTFMELYQDKVRTPSGKVLTYTKFHSSDVVVIVPFLDDGRLVMIKQYRYPLGKTLLEFPAGHVESGEDAAATAARELEEETGYKAAKVEWVYQYHPSVSRTKQLVHVYKATGLAAGKAEHEGSEDIQVEILAVEQLRQMIAKGEVENAGTLISYLLCCTGIVNSRGGNE
jgi:ADP-ribose pyrophosphatase